MENTLRSLPGVVDVKAKLAREKLGEAEVLYDPVKVALKDLKEAVPSASGEKHRFVVLSAVEET